jgi:two-component system, chemotaxis family, chemotaxis protein CheY
MKWWAMMSSHVPEVNMQEKHQTHIRGKRTLIVEEEFYSRWYMRRLLEPYSPCDVVVRGEEAVEVFKLSCESGTPYALVLIDMSLPEMSGDAVLQEIRRIEQQRKQRDTRTAVIMIASGVEHESVSDHVWHDCEALLAKPILKGELLDTLQFLGLISV